MSDLGFVFLEREPYDTYITQNSCQELELMSDFLVFTFLFVLFAGVSWVSSTGAVWIGVSAPVVVCGWGTATSRAGASLRDNTLTLDLFTFECSYVSWSYWLSVLRYRGSRVASLRQGYRGYGSYCKDVIQTGLILRCGRGEYTGWLVVVTPHSTQTKSLFIDEIDGVLGIKQE